MGSIESGGELSRLAILVVGHLLDKEIEVALLVESGDGHVGPEVLFFLVEGDLNMLAELRSQTLFWVLEALRGQLETYRTCRWSSLPAGGPC